ncbi:MULTISPECIES: hypothetical protein [unclassified Lysinibacillus]|uniref:hypothetical protein n=1 Tax=unclassified Lysinibacillus TaxID=2636778 RepID=UPI003802C7B9
MKNYTRFENLQEVLDDKAKEFYDKKYDELDWGQQGDVLEALRLWLGTMCSPSGSYIEYFDE